MTAWKKYGTIPEATSEEDRTFFSAFLKYYSQLKLDPYDIWTAEEKTYYKKHGLPYVLRISPKYYYDLFRESLAKVEGQRARELEELLSSEYEFSHWWFVVLTRNHACTFERKAKWYR